MKTKRVWLWLIPLSLLWPVVHLVGSWIRFTDFSFTDITYLLDFFPMSIISGIVFVLLWTRLTSRGQKIDLLLGYIIASPFAYLGSLSSGLVYSPPIIGTLIWGLGPLLAGMLLGLLVGFIFTKLIRN